MKTWHWIALILLILASLVVEFTMLSGHSSHWWSHVPAFYIIWGFLSCVVLTYFAKGLGKLILYREEDYYDN